MPSSLISYSNNSIFDGDAYICRFCKQTLRLLKNGNAAVVDPNNINTIFFETHAPCPELQRHDAQVNNELKKKTLEVFDSQKTEIEKAIEQRIQLQLENDRRDEASRKYLENIKNEADKRLREKLARAENKIAQLEHENQKLKKEG
jgi:glutaredoxin